MPMLTGLFTVVVIAAIVWLLTRLRRPYYRRSRRDVIALLRATEAGETPVDAWVIFIGMPIRHDPHLEQARLACQQMDDDPSLVKRRVPDGRLELTESGRQRCREIIDELERSATRPV